MDLEKTIEKWNNDYLYFEEIKELLDALIEERKTRQDLAPKKWEPEGGEWNVSLKLNFRNRLSQTKNQARYFIRGQN